MKMKKVLSVLAVSLLVLTGCQKAADLEPAEVIQKISEAQEDLEVYDLDAEMNVAAAKMDIKIRMDQEENAEVDINAKFQNESSSAKMYMVKGEGEKYDIYSRSEMPGSESPWSHYQEDADPRDLAVSIEGIEEILDDLDMKVDGSNYVFEGSLSPEELDKVLSSEVTGTSLASLGIDGEMKVKYVFDGEDFHLLESHIDGTELMKSAVSDGQSVDEEALKFTIDVKVLDANKDFKVEVPEEAKNAVNQ